MSDLPKVTKPVKPIKRNNHPRTKVIRCHIELLQDGVKHYVIPFGTTSVFEDRYVFKTKRHAKLLRLKFKMQSKLYNISKIRIVEELTNER